MPVEPAEPAPPGFYPPEPYAPWWIWVSLGVLALIVLWYAVVWWLTRQRPVRVPPRITGDRLDRLRADYARQIDIVASQAERGEITHRRAHQQLSVLVRHFVQDVSGIAAPTMTLTDLTRSGERLSPVSDVVAILYPGEFEPGEAQTVSDAAEMAKQVVTRWS